MSFSFLWLFFCVTRLIEVEMEVFWHWHWQLKLGKLGIHSKSFFYLVRFKEREFPAGCLVEMKLTLQSDISAPRLSCQLVVMSAGLLCGTLFFGSFSAGLLFPRFFQLIHCFVGVGMSDDQLLIAQLLVLRILDSWSNAPISEQQMVIRY